MDDDFMEDNVEDVPLTSHELLFNFLYAIRQHHLQPELEKIFSPGIDLTDWIKIAVPYIGADYQDFQQLTESGRVQYNGMTFVHDADVVDHLSAEAKKSLKRSMLERIPANKKSSTYNCTLHNKICCISSEEYVFFCVLNQNAPAVTNEEVPVVPSTQDVDDEALTAVDESEERELSLSLNTNALREYGVDMHEEDERPLDEGLDLVPVPVLPSFPIGDKQYVLVSDLQHVFNIREDYCLAIIAQNLEEAENFLDEDVNKYALVDSGAKDSEYMDGKTTLAMIFADSKRYEETLPTEAEFNALQAQMGLTGMGRDTSGGTDAVSGSFVDLWKKRTVEEDENQKLFVFEDEFLLRGSGSRVAGRGKDSALSNYIRHLKFPQFICLHHKFSTSTTGFFLFAIKVLSRYLGGYAVRMNADKVMLLEKQIALDIFGQAPGVYAMRSRYYLAYAAYGLSCGVRESSQLPDYGKREMLRFRRHRIVPVGSVTEAGESSARDTVEKDENTEPNQNDEPSTKRSRLI